MTAYKKVFSPKLSPMNIALALSAALGEKHLFARWAGSGANRTNWGDALNPVLINLLSAKEPLNSHHVLNISDQPVYSVIGSLLDESTEKNLVVWGTGFQFEGGKFKVKPQKIHAVRGPLSRENVIRSGLECPEVFGDPALLYPMFYRPDGPKKYDMGIIPHYVDKHSSLLDKFSDLPNVKLIDINAPTNKFIDEVSACKAVASSSLHGLIVADAYDIPSTWLSISDKVLGGGFKFRDYFLSVGKPCEHPVELTPELSLAQIFDSLKEPSLDIDLTALLRACPFLSPEMEEKCRP